LFVGVSDNEGPVRSSGHSIALNGPAITFGVVLVAVWEAMTRSLALPQHIFPLPASLSGAFVRADLLVSRHGSRFQTVLGFVCRLLSGSPSAGPLVIADAV
jgi:ABC-type nitrate/sulfonate/bicarbonate transport system permease component